MIVWPVCNGRRGAGGARCRGNDRKYCRKAPVAWRYGPSNDAFVPDDVAHSRQADPARESRFFCRSSSGPTLTDCPATCQLLFGWITATREAQHRRVEAPGSLNIGCRSGQCHGRLRRIPYVSARFDKASTARQRMLEKKPIVSAPGHRLEGRPLHGGWPNP